MRRRRVVHMRKVPQILIYVLVPVTFLVVGAGLGFAAGSLWSLGILVRWERMADVPDGAANVLDGDWSTVTVLTLSGQYVRCSVSSEQCWLLGGRPDVPGATVSACDQNDWRAEFTVVAPPQEPVSHIQIRQCNSEGGTATEYAVMGDGSVWYWRHSRYAPEAIAQMTMIGVLGGGTGIILGIVIVIVYKLLSILGRKSSPSAA